MTINTTGRSSRKGAKSDRPKFTQLAVNKAAGRIVAAMKKNDGRVSGLDIDHVMKQLADWGAAGSNPRCGPDKAGYRTVVLELVAEALDLLVATDKVKKIRGVGGNQTFVVVKAEAVRVDDTKLSHADVHERCHEEYGEPDAFPPSIRHMIVNMWGV